MMGVRLTGVLVLATVCLFRVTSAHFFPLFPASPTLLDGPLFNDLEEHQELGFHGGNNYLDYFPTPPESFRGENHRHRAVVLTAAQEANLPDALRNPFYKNHRIRSALARSSWFGPGERPVYERAAENIPRAEIYKMLHNAGFLPHSHYY